jgi:hypothetical protein
MNLITIRMPLGNLIFTSLRLDNSIEPLGTDTVEP